MAASPPLAGPPGIPVPPPPSSGGGLAASGEEGQESGQLQKEISNTIEAQVARLIDQARHDTESKVKMELKGIRDAMVAMDQQLDLMIVQLDGVPPRQPSEAPVDAEAVGQLLSKIEQQWGQEIRTLKQELHQTILAHNHNADLIKHHKDTIDSLRDRCARTQGNSARTSEISQHLQRLDTRLKQQQKQRKLEPLFERLGALEGRITLAAQAAAVQGAAAWRYAAAAAAASGAAPPAGLGGLPGIPPGLLPGGAPGLAKAAAAAKANGVAPGNAAALAAAAAALAGLSGDLA